MTYSYTPLYGGHDSYFHFRRFKALMNALQQGTFPGYIDYDAMSGYGYMVKAFYSDVLLIPFALIALCTSPIQGYELMIFVMTLVCGILSYISVERIFKNRLMAFVTAILYTFCIYKLTDTYLRGAIGEAFSFSFVPVVFWGLYEIISGNYKKWFIISIGYSMMIFTHLLSTILMFIIMVIIMIIYYKPLIKEPKRLLYLLLAGGVSIILVSYFLIPLAEQLLSGRFYFQSKTIMSTMADARLSNLDIIQGMFSGVVQPSKIFMPGIGFILTCAVTLRILIKEKSPALKSVDIGVIMGLVFVVATSFFFPWDKFPLNNLSFIQFPWRLYEFTSFFFAVAGGFYFSRLFHNKKRIFFAILMLLGVTILVIVNDANYYQSDRSYYKLNEKPNELNRYHLGGFEYLPEKFPYSEYFLLRGDSIGINNCTSKANCFTRNNGKNSVDLVVYNTTSIELPLTYYKGYRAKANDGTKIPVKESKNGLVEVNVKKSGRVEVWYDSTFAQKTGLYISLIAIIILCIYIYMPKRKIKP